MAEAANHIELAQGLRAVADMVEQNPEIARFASFGDLYAFHVGSAEEHATMIRAALKAGAVVEKQISESLYNVVLRFGPVGAMVLANRAAVCERVQVGTKTETKRIKDPVRLAEVPEVEVTEEVPVYEWECKPLLSNPDGA